MNNCQLCGQSQRQLILDKLQSKYFEAFNFYFAKPINEILSSCGNTPHVIYFKDYVILDEQQEYLKRQTLLQVRFYQQEEVKPRVDILTEFYATNYKQMHPNLLITDQYLLMTKRNKKIDKLYYQRMQESDPQEKEPVISNKVLNSKLTSNSQISYETEEHDIYDSQDPPNHLQRIDFKGLPLLHITDYQDQFNEMYDKQITNINQMTSKSRSLPQNFYIKSPFQSAKTIQINKDVHKNVKRRTNHMDLREKKAIFANSKSESKHSQSSFKMSKIKDSVDQQTDQLQEFVSEEIEGKPKMSRIQSDNLTIQKMLKDYQKISNNRQLRSTISQDLIAASTSTVIQGFQGSQKSINNNNGSLQNISQRQEQLKKIYQPITIQQKKFNYIDKIAKGGCLTDRNQKQLPIAEDLFNKLHDIKIRSSQNAESLKKPEFNYMIPSQYNTLNTFKNNGNKAKSQYTKKNTQNDLGTKSQHQNNSSTKLLINPQKTDDIVKKYIQMATQSIQQHKKFDFKLNLQNLNDHDEEFCILTYLFRKQAPQFSYRKAQLTPGKGVIQHPQKNCDQMINFMFTKQFFTSIKTLLANRKPITINQTDLEWKSIKGGGPGGQAVNKTSNCVQLTHLPSGIQIKCHKSRDMEMNKIYALQQLKEKLDEQINGECSLSNIKSLKVKKQKQKREKRSSEKYGN